jgi:hypothetical protein
MLKAIWKQCGFIQNGGDKVQHSYLDFCCSCAPYWETYPACPTCNKMLGKKNHVNRNCRRKCNTCDKYVYVDYAEYESTLPQYN